MATDKSEGLVPVWERFAIRHIPTGKYLPERWRKGRGYSWDEPSFGFPRLFPSERSAKMALNAWLRGRWDNCTYVNDSSDIFYVSWETGLYSPTPVSGRIADDMEIVRIAVSGVAHV